MNNETFSKMNKVSQYEYREEVRDVLEYLKCQYDIIPELFYGDWAGGCSWNVNIDMLVNNIGISSEELNKKICGK
jgi:hypothetical protein